MNDSPQQYGLQPEDANVPVWRYLELPKFISMLDKKQLYMARADSLGDQHEGSITLLTRLKREKRSEEKGDNTLLSKYTKLHCILRKSTYISSWYMSEQESYAMWKLYCGTNQGVAIRTTYKNLTECLVDSDVYIGRVSYIDYVNDHIPDKLAYEEYFLYKRIFFEYEREVRLIKCMYSSAKNENKIMPEGIQINVYLDKLIDFVYVNPYAPEWYYEVITSLIGKYYPVLSQKIKWSSLRSEPIF